METPGPLHLSRDPRSKVANPKIPEIPEKFYFKIGEVAKLAGEKPYVLRYWESEFEWLQPEKTKSNQRVYSRKDVMLVLLINMLLHQRRYTIEGASKILAGLNGNWAAGFELPAAPPSRDKKKATPEPPPPEGLEELRKKVAHLERRISVLTKDLLEQKNRNSRVTSELVREKERAEAVTEAVKREMDELLALAEADPAGSSGPSLTEIG